MRKWVKNTLAAVGITGIFTVATGVGLGIAAAPAAEVGTGYYAQAACATRYVLGKYNWDPDIPDHPVAGMITPARNIMEHSTSASILGLYTKRAYDVDNSGCVIADEPPDYSTSVPDIGTRAEAIKNIGGGVPQPTVEPDDPARKKELDEAVDKALDAEGARAVVIMKQGAVVAEGYADNFDAFTPQLGWSMSKSLANLIAGRLAQQDKTFSINDSHLRPEWDDADDERADITIDQLMRMTSGLEWNENYDTGGDTPQMLYRESDMAAYAADKPAKHDPGTYQQYSTGSTNLLCNALQEKSGMGIDMAWKLLFKPLGMLSAEMAPDASGNLVCGSYTWATPRDWAKMGQFVANGGEINGEKLLPDGWLKNSTTATKVSERHDPDSPAYGAGWWLNKSADGSLFYKDMPEDMIWADGHDGQYTVIIPSKNVVVVRQGFSPDATLTSSGTFDVVRAALASSGDSADGSNGGAGGGGAGGGYGAGAGDGGGYGYGAGAGYGAGGGAGYGYGAGGGAAGAGYGYGY